MKKKIFVFTLIFALVFSVSACKKKEPEPPVPKAPGQMAPGPIMQGPISPEAQQTVPGSGMPVQGAEKQVVVPESVKGKWSAVKIIVEDKVAKKTQEYKINLNSDFKIPNSNLKFYVGEFLPDFKMDGLALTSASNQPNNPAVGIRVLEGNTQIFPTIGKKWGWLFSKMPTVHPLDHEKYNLILKEGIAKKG